MMHSIESYSQRNNVWAFGDHEGIDFNGIVPVEMTNISMESFECSASICDSAGNLLMYSNGGGLTGSGIHGAIWNRFHNEMPNGNLDSCSGCTSSKQGALFVPDPGDPEQYYFFTEGCQENGMHGLYFSKIDMRLDSGRGDVTIKDSLLISNMTECVAAIQHGNGTDFWIISRSFSGVFYLYLVSAAGISGYNGYFPQPSFSEFNSYIVANCMGNRILVAGQESYLYDFDNMTGIISNPVLVDSMNPGYYGAAFSPTGRFIYLSRSQSLKQYDLFAPDIRLSGVLISNYPWIEALALAPDGKIYVSKYNQTSLGTINNPDQADTACGYVHNSFPLSNQSKYGVPNCVNTFSGGCLTTKASVHELNSGRNNFKISPNPASSHVKIEGFEKINSLKLLDVTGRIMIEKNFPASVEYDLDISSVAEGIYIVVMQTPRGDYTGKVVKSSLK
jgi:hypothetical protein